ncbi:MAG: transcriptional regulator [Candidatus Nitrosocosmicus sp.]|nr:transcriptional regulator [Candidatus Nitrosocosmicus sp.]MDN5868104.1 transcriptional regulator [Candidatus Nitrosocosmicus sp.]
MQALTEEQLQKIDMLPKMKNKLVLTPELAPLFTGNEDELQKTLGIKTRVLDGHGLENDSGAHGHRKYGDTMFVWLGAAVEIPFRVWKLLGTLGHKIYFLRPALKKKTVEDLKRIAKSNNFSSINKEIEEALLDYLKTFDAAPEVDGKIKIENEIVKVRWNEEKEGEQDKVIGYISQLANLLASLRGDVHVSQTRFVNRKVNYTNDNTSSFQEQQPHQLEGQDYDTDFPNMEDASRAVVLLRNLAIGHAVSQGRDSLTIGDVPIAIKVALSTAPVRRVRILDLLLKNEYGLLATSQICNELSISQPVVTRTMREFAALGLADISSVNDYGNSELQIKLNHEFDWFRTNEFLNLKEDFVPYEKKNNKNEGNNDDSYKQTVDDSGFTGDCDENRVNKNGNTDNPISQTKERVSPLENKKPCDNNKGCHTLKQNLPPEAQQKNNVLDSCINQSESSKKDNDDLQSSIIQHQDEAQEHHLTKTEITSSSNQSDIQENENEKNNVKNNVSLRGSKSFEHVTV